MRRNDWIFLRSLIEQVNPLKLVNDDHTSRVFHCRRDLYLVILKTLDELSSGIYVDVPYVIYVLYKLRQSTINGIVMRHFKPLGIDTYVLLDGNISKNKKFYRDFIRALHSYCETEFDISQFDVAYQEFVILKERELLLKNEQNKKGE